MAASPTRPAAAKPKAMGRCQLTLGRLFAGSVLGSLDAYRVNACQKCKLLTGDATVLRAESLILRWARAVFLAMFSHSDENQLTRWRYMEVFASALHCLFEDAC